MESTHTPIRLRVQPSIASKVIEQLRGGDGPLTELVEADPSLCAVIVRAANAVHLGLSRRVGGVRQAMVLLGQDAATALAVARTADLVFEEDEGPAVSSWVWPQAVACATAASSLARLMDSNPEQAYTAGLLQNLWVLMGEKHDAEHAGQTADLLESWNFPEAVAAAVRNHHRSLDDLVNPLDRAVACGRTIAAEAGFPDARPVAPIREVMRAADIGKQQLSSVLNDVERALGSLVRLAATR